MSNTELPSALKPTRFDRVIEFANRVSNFVFGDSDFDDPLAVEIGLGVSAHDIPADGWADTFNLDTARSILDLYPKEEQY